MKPTSKNLLLLPIGMHRYERGLYVRVTATSRSWVFKYQLNGRRREMGFGPVEGQAVSSILGKASAARFQIDRGIDPLAEKEARRAEAVAEAKRAKMVTFAEFAPKAVERIFKIRKFRGDNTECSWLKTLDRLVKLLGKHKLDEISTRTVVEALEPAWENSASASEELQGRLSNILDVAVTEGYIELNPAAWARLKMWLPSPSTLRRAKPAKHHAALSAEDLSSLAQRLWADGSKNSLAILFGILTVGRRQEYLEAKWSEIDTEELTLSVPPERRKDGKLVPHVVPLSRQAQRLLERLDTSSEHLFPGRGCAHISPTSLSNVAASLSTEDKPFTLHGIRSTFSDWCARNEKNFVVSEKCLMHAVGNAVFRAYQRDDLLEQRRKLLQEWADFLLPNV